MGKTNTPHSICFTLEGFRSMVMYKPAEHGIYVEIHALKPRPTGIALDAVKKKVCEQARALGWPEHVVAPSFVRYDGQQFALML